MLLNTLTPTALKSNPKSFRSARLIILIDLILLGLALAFMPLFWWIDFTAGFYIMIYTVINATIFLGIMYYTHNFLLCGNFFCINSWLVFTALIYYSGGTCSPYFLWLLSIPPIALFYMRSRYANFWIAATICSAVGIALAEMLGFTFPQQLAGGFRPFIALFNYFLLLLLFVAVVLSFKDTFKRINKKMSKTNEKLKRSNRDLERFAYVASHDLKSPLRNVISFISLFNRRFGKDLEAEPREYLEIAQNNALQMQNLIEDILEYSQSSNKPMRTEEVDLNHQLKLIGDQLKRNPAYENAELVVAPLPRFTADSVRMHQLFQNLVENGLKYNRSVRPRVEVEYHEEEEMHTFVVLDNGIGIPEAFHDRIFKMFERLHNQQDFQGTGIGLAICLKNVQEYGGSIAIESEEGQGSRFYLRFPKSNLVMLHSPTITVEEAALMS